MTENPSTEEPILTGRHDDQISYYRMFTDRAESLPSLLYSKTVAVVGAGGIGSELMRHLGAAGVGKIVCIDSDLVQASNLNRQHFYTPADIGKRKAECVKGTFSTLFPETEIIPAYSFIDSKEKLTDTLSQALNTHAGIDFIACCADQPVGQVECACLLTALDIQCPVGFSAMHLRRGYWGLACTPKSQRNAISFFKRAVDLAAKRTAKPVIGSSSWTNGVIGAFFSESVIMTLFGLPPDTTDRLTAFDFQTMCSEHTFLFNS